MIKFLFKTLLAVLLLLLILPLGRLLMFLCYRLFSGLDVCNINPWAIVLLGSICLLFFFLSLIFKN